MADLNPELQPPLTFRPAFVLVSSLALVIFTASALIGCGKSAPSKATATGSPAPQAAVDPMEAEHDGMRQGATQLTQAITSLHDGVDTLNELKKSSKDSQLITALASIATNLDDAGSGISDFSSEPPDLATFKSQFSAQDTRRLSAIDAANDALHDLDEATDALDPFLDHANPEDKDSVDNLESSMEDAQDALIEAIKSLGGKVEDDGTTDLSGDGTTAPDSKAQTSSANSSNQESNSAGSTTGT